MEGNWIDICVVAVVALSSLLGLWRGLIRAVFGVLGLVAAVAVTVKFGDFLRAPIENIIDESWASWASVALSYVTVFFVVLVLVSLIARAVIALIQKLDLGGFNLLGGFIFGVVRGGVFALLAVVLLALFPLQETRPWQESRAVPFFGKVIKYALKMPLLADYKKYWRFDEKSRPRAVYVADDDEPGLIKSYREGIEKAAELTDGAIKRTDKAPDGESASEKLETEKTE